MMRSNYSDFGQSSRSSDQKKSVFDRLGRQIDSEHQMKQKPSPGQYGDYMSLPLPPQAQPPPPPPMHEPDFGRHSRDMHSHAEMEWRYQNDRRCMPPFPRDRHPQQLPPPPMQPPPMYDMEMSSRHNSYYSHPYHNGPPLGPPLSPMGPGNMSMSMNQQRSSPKYDRHGNPLMSYKDRAGSMRFGPMDHHPMSPPNSFMPPGPPMMPPGPHEMGPMRPNEMYPPHRWQDEMEPEFPVLNNRMLPEEQQFGPMSSRRYQQQQQQMIPQQQIPSTSSRQAGEVPRYAKWKERRDVITSLDRETSQLSSRTNSLKSTLQHSDGKGIAKIANVKDQETKAKLTSSTQPKLQNDEETQNKDQTTPTASSSTPNTVESNQESDKKKSVTSKDPQDISDGEIIDDEDSSDDSESSKPMKNDANLLDKDYANNRMMKGLSGMQTRDTRQGSLEKYSREQMKYFGASKKRRNHERDDYLMDYETISEDEDLDILMGDKKIADMSLEGSKLTYELSGDDSNRSLSEVELLNALGLDWASLVEMAKQSRTTSKECQTSSSALKRFSIPNYLPTLKVSQDLVGAELYELILKICHG